MSRIKVGMPLQYGSWRGHVWKVWRGLVFSVQYVPGTEVMCDYRVHHSCDVTVTRAGNALALPLSDLSKQRVARSWQKADA